MPPRVLLPVFFLVLLGGAAILGPLLYFALQQIYPVPFHRAMNRAILICALAAMALAWSRIPFRQLWPLEQRSLRDFILGLIIALVSAQAMIGLALAAGAFEFADISAGKFAGRLGIALLAATLVPLAEETLFRGFMQREMIAAIGWRAGWIGTAVIFAISHFLKIPHSLNDQPVHLWSGFIALSAAFGELGSGLFLSGKGINLLLIGLILGGIVFRSGSLWLNYGLHAGWVFCVLLFTAVTKVSDKPHISWLGGDILSSFGTTIVLLLLGFWVWRFYRNPSDTPEAGEPPP